MNPALLGLILFSVSLNSLAQVFLRRGMMHFGFDPAHAVKMVVAIVGNVWVWGGMACYAISILSWMLVLSKLQVSVAYPFLSVGYVIAAVMGVMFLGETIGPQRMIGIGLICGGLFFITRSA
jgi:multidrug transporter EmrE-like cation transporter